MKSYYAFSSFTQKSHQENSLPTTLSKGAWLWSITDMDKNIQLGNLPCFSCHFMSFHNYGCVIYLKFLTFHYLVLLDLVFIL